MHINVYRTSEDDGSSVASVGDSLSRLQLPRYGKVKYMCIPAGCVYNGEKCKTLA